MKGSAKNTAALGICTALALVFAYVEVLLPPIYAAVPGIKLGLPNIVIIFALYRLGLWKASMISFVRVLIVSIVFGNFMMFAYSMAGAVLSLAVMAILKKADLFSTVGVSVAGAILHNVGQILMAMLLLGTAELGYYLIVLAITGTISGILIGQCGAIAIKRIPNKLF